MTIPSRPAPAPPQQQQASQQLNATSPTVFPIKLPPPPASGSFQRTFTTNNTSNTLTSSNLHNDSSGASITRHFPAARYAPATNWDGSPFDLPSAHIPIAKKAPPPRPPPPKLPSNLTGNTVLKKPGPPQSVNVLSNLFGRRKGTTKVSKQQAQQQQQQPQTNFSQMKLSSLPTVPQNNNQNSRFTFMSQSVVLSPTAGDLSDAELIKFDSPPSSPTFTQKSNSDCVSVDSFSSDSNFSSPQNGSVSQPESGFEDDFLSPTDPWDAFNSISSNSTSNGSSSRNYGFLNDIRVTQPSVRNLDAIARTPNDNPLCNGKSLLPPQTVHMPTIIKPKTSQTTSSNTSSPVHLVNTSSKSQMPSTLQVKYTDNFPESYCTYKDGESSPPMPSCPPPPLPSSTEMLDVIAGRLDVLDIRNCVDDDDSMSYGIALYDFEGTEDDDLSFKMNEKIYLLQKLNDEWYMGRNKRGCEGIFPSNYIDVKIPPKDDTMHTANGKAITTISNISSTITSDSQAKVRVLFNFNAEVPEDLTLKENDMVTVLYRINDEWLYGQRDTARGQFPANFIEYIPQNLPNGMP